MANVADAGTSTIQVTEGSGASRVILIAMVILFGGAAYFTGRLYGRVGMIAVVAGFVVVLVGLLALGELSFGYVNSGVARRARHATRTRPGASLRGASIGLTANLSL